MAKPAFFSFSIKRGDPVRLATAMRAIIAALDPLTDTEARDVVREVEKMFASKKSLTAPGAGVTDRG